MGKEALLRVVVVGTVLLAGTRNLVRVLRVGADVAWWRGAIGIETISHITNYFYELLNSLG